MATRAADSTAHRPTTAVAHVGNRAERRIVGGARVRVRCAAAAVVTDLTRAAGGRAGAAVRGRVQRRAGTAATALASPAGVAARAAVARVRVAVRLAAVVGRRCGRRRAVAVARNARARAATARAGRTGHVAGAARAAARSAVVDVGVDVRLAAVVRQRCGRLRAVPVAGQACARAYRSRARHLTDVRGAAGPAAGAAVVDIHVGVRLATVVERRCGWG